MKHAKQQGFTLVELIVVITILAILGSIGFISLKSWTADARDSKRKSDIASINKAINLETIKGVSLRAFADGSWSTITVAGTGGSTQIRISGVEGYTALSGSYVGWDVNYTALQLDRNSFLDPTKNVAYKFGMTDYSLAQYEIAAALENGWDPDTLTLGTWIPRKSWSAYEYPGSQSNDTFTLSGITIYDTNLRVNDTVRFNSGSLDTDKYKIIKISNDKIQVDRTITSPGSVIFVPWNETRHLIKRWKSNSAIDIGAGGDYTPYSLN